MMHREARTPPMPTMRVPLAVFLSLILTGAATSITRAGLFVCDTWHHISDQHSFLPYQYFLVFRVRPPS